MVVVPHQCGWCGQVTNHFCKEATTLRKEGYLSVTEVIYSGPSWEELNRREILRLLEKLRRSM